MPKKYHIETKKAPNRFLPVSKAVAFEREGCLGCLKCVKRESCVYDVYQKRAFDPMRVEDSTDSLCMSCMRCVQECKKGILARAPNPAYRKIGDAYWSPDLLTSLWKQAETGKIPVSGAGYRGPFTGPGWDGMWTDMSEIVRPTRDGIHGREYISTAVDLGGKADVLAFDAAGRLESDGCRMIDIPLPVVLELPGRGKLAPPVRAAMARAAKKLGTLFVATAEEARGPLARHQESILLRLDEGERLEANTDLLDRVPIAEIPWTVDACERAGKLRAAHAGLIVAVRLRFDEKAVERAESLTRGGVEILHIEANLHGRGLGAANGRFLRDMIREVHLKLVEGRLRDRTTLVVWGGIGMAEHMAKAIACGADAVGVGSALMASLECRLCASCEEGFPCPVEIEAIDPAWGEKRIVNLMGSWHSQLLEVLGAMGLREVRRLRGEVGRVMFFEDLERECFGPIFGRRKGAAAAGGAPNAA